MSVICPTVLANNETDFAVKIQKINFADRLQIDIMDGVFTDSKSIELAKIPYISDKKIDLHVMYERPGNYLEEFIRLKPHMVIVHAESNCDIPKLAADLREHNIKTGVAILQKTSISEVAYLFPHVQHLLIFAGNLGHYGGQADLSLLSKIKDTKQATPYIEYGWDGGANVDNIRQLQNGGVDIINVGSALQDAENSHKTFQEMVNLLA
jgi:ribulose-phosphate 3-epimerase